MCPHSCLMYPCNATALILGRHLLTSGHDISLFCPTDLHLRQALTMPVELGFLARSLGRSCNLMENLDSLNTVDFLIFPTLDIDPSEKRENLATMIKDLFQWVFAGGKASLKKKGETGLISIVSKPF